MSEDKCVERETLSDRLRSIDQPTRNPEGNFPSMNGENRLLLSFSDK